MNANDIEIHYITNDEDALKALFVLDTYKFCGLDCETTGLHSMNQSERLRLLSLTVENAENPFRDSALPKYLSFLFDIWELGPEPLELLAKFITSSGRVKIGHNLKFDMKFLRDDLGITNFGTLFDTMLAAQILAMGWIYSGFGLDDVVREYLQQELDKTLQTSDWSGELTQEQLIYAARDGAVLLPLREVMMAQLKQHNLLRTAKLEFEAWEPVASMERNGLKLNKRKWAKVYRKNYLRQQVVAEQLHMMLGRQLSLLEGIPSEVNLGSTKDIIAAYNRLGVKLPKMDGSEDVTTLSWKLVGIQDSHPSIPLLIENRGLMKSISSYGLNWFEYINDATGRIHGQFNPLGTKTTRYASYDPNLQNLKQDNEYRNCFEAELGFCLVWADYSQMELREAAEFSGDELMIAAFKSGEDFHKYTAALCYQEVDEPTKEHINLVTKDERSIIKNMNYLITYGGGPPKLSEQAGIPLERAEEVINIYLSKFKGLNNWLETQGNHAARYHETWTIIGRKLKIRFDPNDKKAVGHAKRNGKNTPMQGSCADILKRALRLLYDLIQPYGDDMLIVNIVHDEIVLEVREDLKLRAAFLLKKAMLDAAAEFLKTVPVEISLKAGKVWRK